MSVSIFNGKSELSISADTGGALLPWTANFLPITSNFVNVVEEIYVERGTKTENELLARTKASDGIQE